MIFIGIDPGVSGAVAAIGPNSCAVEDIPTIGIEGAGRTVRKIDGLELARLLRRMVPAGEECVVVLEDVHVMPSNKSGSAANTSLLHSKGVIEGVLAVMRMPTQLVNSQRWKRVYGLGSDKKESLEKARTLYPDLAKSRLARVADHNRAEGLLLAHYGKVKLA